MFSYLIVAVFAVLSVSSRALPRAACSLASCDLPTPSAIPSSVLVPAPTLSPSPTPTSCNATSSPPAIPTPSVAPTTSVSPSSAPASPAALTAVFDASNGPFTGGFATYFYQNGNPGACGQVNSDTSYIGAMDQTRFGTSGSASPLCGQKVQITNVNNGQTVTVTIADDCPTCANENSIDLSVAAFQAISDLSAGQIPISWVYV